MLDNWYKETYDACTEVATNLLKGYFDEYEYREDDEITDIFKYITEDKWARFQVFKERETGLYSVYFSFCGEPCFQWEGYDLDRTLTMWINFIEECKEEVRNEMADGVESTVDYNYTRDTRETFEIGKGWLGHKITCEMLENKIFSMEYDVYMERESDVTYVTTWSKECKEVLKNKGYKIIK